MLYTKCGPSKTAVAGPGCGAGVVVNMLGLTPRTFELQRSSSQQIDLSIARVADAGGHVGLFTQESWLKSKPNWVLIEMEQTLPLGHNSTVSQSRGL